MGKYEPLRGFLTGRPGTESPMTFAEIEAVIGVDLPPAAGRHPAWWSNNASNNVMTRVWLDAGFRTEKVDLGSRRLVFRRVSPPKASPAPARFGPDEGPSAGVIGRIRAALKGTVRFAPGFDPTAPTGEAWDAQGS